MTKSEQAQEANDYIIEINKLLGQAIDFAFVPVDPRLKEHAYLAANYFIETLHPKFLLPMHAFGEYSFYSNLQNHLKMHSTTLIKVVDKNQIVFDSTMK
jgi:L-ascorbate metabolism protein UlaG (beta-lactamase superfamily)